jgi:anti-sigma regulatory factor (Ser/Thr protein kinase)
VTEPLLVRSDGVNFPAVRVWAEQACRACVPAADAGAVDAGAVDAVALALHETVRNVVEHAYEGTCGAIELRAELRGRTLVLTVVHDGPPFDRAAVRAPSFDGSRESGFGLFLVDRAVDSVEYGRTPDGRGLVRLEKQLT